MQLADLAFKMHCKKIQIPLTRCCLCSDPSSPWQVAGGHKENRKALLVPETIFLFCSPENIFYVGKTPTVHI